MIYVVQFGDILSRICETLFDDSLEMYALADFNDLRDKNLIRVGQTLKLHKAPKHLTASQKVVNVEPSGEKLEQIMNLFRYGFCDESMALEIYRTAIK